METLTVKNNKIDYSTLKKVIFYFFPTYYILLLVTIFCGALIALFINLSTRDVIYIIGCIIILLMVPTALLFNEKIIAKKCINQLNDLYHTDVIFYDLVFGEDKLTSIEYSSKNEVYNIDDISYSMITDDTGEFKLPTDAISRFPQNTQVDIIIARQNQKYDEVYDVVYTASVSDLMPSTITKN